MHSKAVAAVQQGYKALTVACLEHKNDQLNVKSRKKSTELNEILKLRSVLKCTTSFGKKSQMFASLVAKKYLR